MFYLEDVLIYVFGTVGIIAFILLAGFAEGGNTIAAVVSLMILLIALSIAVRMDQKNRVHEKR